MGEDRQEYVFPPLQKNLQGINPFELKLNGFGCFQNSNVIYLDVEQTEELESLEKLFRYSKKQLRLGRNYHVVNNYHLTIAGGLHPDIFEYACDYYLLRTYHNSFWIDKLTVLRRSSYGGWYSKLMDLKLGNNLF